MIVVCYEYLFKYYKCQSQLRSKYIHLNIKAPGLPTWGLLIALNITALLIYSVRYLKVLRHKLTSFL